MKLKDINIRDPFILCCNDMYYMYGKKSLEQKGFVVYKSNDLIEWEAPIQVFTPNVDFWADKDFWAPEVHYYCNRYYMLASFKSETRRRATQILVADAPDGEFHTISDTPVTPEEWDSLDGTLYIDRFGKPHIVFCHEWEQGGNGSVCEMVLSDDLKTAITKPRILWYAGDCKKSTDAIPHKKSLVTDGPFMYRLKNNELICIWSTFTENGYSEFVSRSDNGDIDGNWSIDPKPLLEAEGGHGMIFHLKDGKPMFVMHSPNCRGLERAELFEVMEQDNSIVLTPYNIE